MLDINASEVSALDMKQAMALAAKHAPEYTGKRLLPHGWGNGADIMVDDLRGEITNKDAYRTDFSILRPRTQEQKYAGLTALAACNVTGGNGSSAYSGRGGFYLDGTASEDNPGFNPNKGQASNAATDIAGATGGGYEWGLDKGNINSACAAAFRASADADWWSGEDEGRDIDTTGAGQQAKKEMLPAFIMPGMSGAIEYKVQGSRTKDFISSMYGTTAGSSTVSVYMYATLSPLSTLPIMIISLLAVFMRIAMVLGLLGLWVAIMVSPFAANPWDEKLKKPLMQILTSAVMVSGLAAVLGILLTLSVSLSQAVKGIIVSAEITGVAASAMTVVVACVSPTIALLAMHYLWKKTFNAPSPFTLKGAQAWSKGAPMGMNALASGAGAMAGTYLGSKMGSMARGAGRRMGGRLMDGLLDRGRGGGKSGRRSSMGGGGGNAPAVSSSAQKPKDENYASDLAEGLAAQKAAKKAQHKERFGRFGSVLAQGGSRVKDNIAGAYRSAKSNLSLAATQEGREKLSEAYGERVSSVKSALGAGWNRVSTKDGWQETGSAMGRGMDRLGEAALSSVGLDAETRDRINMGSTGKGQKGFAMLSTATASVAGTGRRVAEAGGRAAAAGGRAAHRAIMRNAGPDATVGQAYRRFGRQAATVAGASLLNPGVGGLVFATMGATNTKRAMQSAGVNRQRRKAARNDEIVAQVRAQKAAAEAAQKAAARAEK